MKRTPKSSLAAAVSLATAMMAGQAHAAGFALMEQNATDLGQAYANLATGNGQSNAIFGNPASMALVDGTAVSGGINYIDVTFELDQGAAASPIGPINGGLGGNAGESALLPNASIVHQLGEKTRVGLALSVPFGLSTEYDEGWLGRYHGVESHVEVLDINPVISYDLTPRFTVGAGINVQYAQAELTSAIDGGAACVAAQGPETCTQLGLTPGDVDSDGHVRIDGDDWSVGYNLGVLWQATDRTRFGLSYRSGIDHKLQGDVDYEMPPALAGSPAFADSAARAGLDLPPSMAASMTHAFSEALTGSLGLLWTGWSSFDELRVEQGGGRDDLLTTENWDDALRVAVGGEWQVAPRWTLRAGTAYDPTPVPSAEYRTTRLPDADRIWSSVGVGYEMAANWSVDLGYTHLWLNDSRIDNTTESAIPNRLTGEYSGEVDILGVQLNARF
ncbi:OmpP1/FadL family transporter [Guyparkeria sp.]|uniref:OmpP1/FadL family transporter n=1 Tax=Guyparkeria sp. TaxID=2035736 RepID=UPI00356751A7